MKNVGDIKSLYADYLEEVEKFNQIGVVADYKMFEQHVIEKARDMKIYHVEGTNITLDFYNNTVLLEGERSILGHSDKCDIVFDIDTVLNKTTAQMNHELAHINTRIKELRGKIEKIKSNKNFAHIKRVIKASEHAEGNSMVTVIIEPEMQQEYDEKTAKIAAYEAEISQLDTSRPYEII